MKNQMTDPMNALESFQSAFAGGFIAPKKGEIHQDLLVLLDHPNDEPRFTYALAEKNAVTALANFILADPINGFPCFNMGYAVDPKYRSKGLGKEVVQKAFDELANGFKRNGVPHLYVEAIISTSNDHSNKLASKVISNNPTSCIDSESGEPALQYVKQLF